MGKVKKSDSSKTLLGDSPKSKALPQAPATIAEIRAEAKKHAVNTAAYNRAKRRTDAAVRADTFEWNRSLSTIDQLPIHYFRVKEESITGILCPPEFELWKGWTYKIVVEQIDIPGQSWTSSAPDMSNSSARPATGC